MAMAILTWIYLAREMLSISVLQHALAVQSGDTAFDEDGIPSEAALLNCCLGLVVIERETSTIRLTHFTLQEYFDERWEKLFPSGHMLIASTCTTYLNFDHPLLTFRMGRSSTLLRYAAKHLGTHLRKGPDPELEDRVLELITNEGKFQVIQESLPIPRFSINERSAKMPHPLHWVSRYGILSITKQLLEQVDGGVVNMQDGSGMTALSLAVRHGNEEVVKLLLNAECVNADSRDQDGRTPLSHAAWHGHGAVVKLLMDTECVNADSRDRFERTPLFYAAMWGRKSVIKLLMDTECVDADSRDQDGRTPLSKAASGGNEAVVKLLMDTECVNAESRDNFGRTPLLHAARHGNGAVVKMLMDTECVHADSRDEAGRTPLSHAVECCYHERVVKLLMDTECVNAESRDNIGRTPLSYAVEGGHEAVVKLLMDTECVNAESRDNFGRTPL
jgi:ankyrin repeat protein